MQVILYDNSSDKRKLSKSLTKLTTLECQLKEKCSLLQPRLIINHAALSSYARCNYMYIPDFKRYYFCSIVALAGDMLEIDGDVDVLMTYSSGIRAIQCTIVRQENKFNKYFKDDFIAIRANRSIQYVKVGTYNAGTGLYLTVDGGNDNG